MMKSEGSHEGSAAVRELRRRHPTVLAPQHRLSAFTCSSVVVFVQCRRRVASRGPWSASV